MMISKLSPDHKEVIQGIVEDSQWEAINAICNIAVELQESRLCSCKVEDVQIEKMKLEGAKHVRLVLQNVKDLLKNG